MTPEAALYLAKARECLGYARSNLQIGLCNDAGRNAYLAAFHAAQALIFERTGKVGKTHQGVHSQFAQLTKDEASVTAALRSFLPKTYDLKAVADYETGPGSIIPEERVIAAAETAERFIDCMAGLINAAKP